eukprot:TRINITY_DN5220_c0_g1_i2.p2 TRINITY_DN5220_c0_g1~~TRINITY_DN5220_c0_g1_i2.p2  ORF type:complete len:207 (-),score=-18.80 TRINITY_DN5220_c0_g1_i2:318-938(-)
MFMLKYFQKKCLGQVQQYYLLYLELMFALYHCMKMLAKTSLLFTFLYKTIAWEFSMQIIKQVPVVKYVQHMYFVWKQDLSKFHMQRYVFVIIHKNIQSNSLCKNTEQLKNSLLCFLLNMVSCVQYPVIFFNSRLCFVFARDFCNIQNIFYTPLFFPHATIFYINIVRDLFIENQGWDHKISAVAKFASYKEYSVFEQIFSIIRLVF